MANLYKMDDNSFIKYNFTSNWVCPQYVWKQCKCIAIVYGLHISTDHMVSYSIYSITIP